MSDFNWSYDKGVPSRDPSPGPTPRDLLGPPADLTPLDERFERLEILGRGGMGAVFRARDRATGREVALKVLTSPTQAGRQRLLRREGQLTAALVHPGILRVHSAGEIGGVVYLAYELVEDCRPLTAGPGPEGRLEFVQRLIDVADAVGHAHAQGIVHRDLKPDNLLVDAAGRVRVADFGLAWTQGAERLTQSGAVIGTPLYMAPEAFREVQHDVRGDVWSLGVVLYEGLAGTPPFLGESLLNLMAAVTEGKVERPRRLDPTISPALEEVCLKALARDVDRRYPDAGAMAGALRAALEAPQGSRRWAKRGLIAAIVGVAAVGAAVAGVASSTDEATPTPSPSSETSARRAPRTPPVPVKALSQEATSRGARRLRQLRKVEDPASRVARLEEWLREYRGHPRSDEAQEILRETRRVVPRLELVYPSPIASSSDPQASFLTWLSGSRIAMARRGTRPRLMVWSNTGAIQHDLSVTNVECGTLSADGKTLLLAAQDSLHRFAVTDAGVKGAGQTRLSIELTHSARTDFVRILPGGETGLVGLSDGGLFEVEVSSGAVRRHYPTNKVVKGLAVSPDGRWLLMGEWGKRAMEIGPSGVVLVDLATWKAVGRQTLDGRPRVVLAGDGKTAIAGGGAQDLWRLSYGSAGLTLAGAFKGSGLGLTHSMLERVASSRAALAHNHEIRDFAVWKGRLYSVAGQGEPALEGDLRVWDIATRKELWRVELGLVPYAVAVGPAGVSILVGKNTVRVYPSD